MAAFLVILGEHVEQEGLDIIVQCLVVEKEFGKKAQILAVDLRNRYRFNRFLFPRQYNIYIYIYIKYLTLQVIKLWRVQENNLRG